MGLRWGLVLSFIVFFSLACFGEEAAPPAQSQNPQNPQNTGAHSNNVGMSSLGSFGGGQSGGGAGGGGQKGQKGAADDFDYQKISKPYEELVKPTQQFAEKARSNVDNVFKASDEKDESGSQLASAVGKLQEQMAKDDSDRIKEQNEAMQTAVNATIAAIAASGNFTLSALAAAQAKQQGEQNSSLNNYQSSGYVDPNGQTSSPLGNSFNETRDKTTDIRPGLGISEGAYQAPTNVSYR